MNTRHALLAIALVGAVSYSFGRGIDSIEAQGRTGPQDPRVPDPPETVTAERPDSDVLLYGDEGGMAASANGILAVTGSYGVGTAVLYVVDTVSRQLAVYEARGGSRSMRRLVLVGARRIDLDLKLEGYNDESEFTYSALRKMFDENGAHAEEVVEKADLREGR